MTLNISTATVQWGQEVDVRIAADGVKMDVFVNDVDVFDVSTYNPSDNYYIIPVLPGSDIGSDGIAIHNGVKVKGTGVN